MNCGGCGRYVRDWPVGMGSGEAICSHCWFRLGEGEGLNGWRGLAAWAGWVVTAIFCTSVVVLYYVGTGKGAWALLLMATLALSLSLPAALWAAGKRNWKLLGSIFTVPLGSWFFLWRKAPGVGWSGSSFVAWAGAFLILGGMVLLIFFGREMVKLPKC